MKTINLNLADLSQLPPSITNNLLRNGQTITVDGGVVSISFENDEQADVAMQAISQVHINNDE